jgi:hypothetical protein
MKNKQTGRRRIGNVSNQNEPLIFNWQQCLEAGLPDWADFRHLGECLLWPMFLEL